MSPPFGFAYATAASVLVVGIAIISARAYDHSERHYAQNRRPAGSSHVFAAIYRYLQVSSIAIGLGALWWSSPWFLPLHANPILGLAALVASVMAAATFVGAKSALGSEYSPCFDAFMPVRLVERGPYRWIRHPIYTANVALLLALAMASTSGWLALNALMLFGFYRQAALREEHELATEWPEYRDYAARTGRFLPGLGRMPAPPMRSTGSSD